MDAGRRGSNAAEKERWTMMSWARHCFGSGRANDATFGSTDFSKTDRLTVRHGGSA